MKKQAKVNPKILVVGSLNMDLLIKAPRLPRVGESLAVDKFVMVPGGKGANQAVACARLGAEVTLAGRVGKDVFGEIILKSLNQENIDIKYITKDPDASTGMGLVILDHFGRNRVFATMSANMRCQKEDFKVIESIIARFDVVLLQLEISLEVIMDILNMAKENNVLTILDPAPVCPVSPNLFRKVDILVPNQVEAEFFSGQKVKNIQTANLAAQKLIKLGPSVVIIKLGSRGAFLLTHQRKIYVKGEKVNVIDTLGAGDAFVGAFAVSIARGKDFDESLQYANCAGAFATTKSGAQPSMPTFDELEQFISKRKISRTL